MPTQYRPQGRSVKAIADDIEEAVRRGRLLPGTVLPPIRGLAADLGVAPGTVAGAYARLRDRALIESRGRNGTVVRDRPAIRTRPNGPALGPGIVDLSAGQPDPRLLPRLTADMFTALRGPAAAPADGLLPAFAEAASHRLRAEGVPVDELTTCHGGLDGIGRVLSVHLASGDAVGVEDPGWPNALNLLAALGMRAIPVAVDDHGPEPAALDNAIHDGARAVIITSRAHNPTGAFVDADRGAALRTVLARHRDVVLIEDDHAAELSSVGLTPLAGASDHWAFIRSTSKPFGPDLRLGVIAADPVTISRVAGRMRSGSGWVSTLAQRLALALWQSPAVADQVAAAGRTYDERRTGLIAELSDRGVAAVGETGLNVWLSVADETAVVAQLLQAGWAVAAGSRFRQQSGPGIRVTVSPLESSTIPGFADRLAEVVRGDRPTGYTV